MSKTQSTRQAKPEEDTTAKTVVTRVAVRPTAKKAVVLGRVKARGGKVHQVLAPELSPQHLSMDDIERAVELMVAAR